MATSDITVRSARGEDADVLTEVAIRSKGHWGYDEDFMARARPDLTVTPGMIDEGWWVLEADGRPVGFYNLRRRDDCAWLEDLFIDPDRIGHGLGRLAWQHLVERARAMGHDVLRLASDPHAEPFYRAMGARRVGEVEATSTGRSLPLMQLDLIR